MSTFLPFWLGLTEQFGFAGAAMVLIYAGVIALLVAIVLAAARRLRRWVRHQRVSRELRLVHDQAYRERRRSGGPHAA